MNFLRDLGADYRRLERSYFPGTGGGRLSEIEKRAIEADILADFRHAEEGIVRLPHKARLGVYVAYKYYVSLFKKIQTIEPAKIPEVRIRIPNYRKWLILVAAGFRYRNKLL
ncbi:hypothetical protein ACQ86N_29400 [Puia sp. P3]|uniref:hypothetical protein n=1 Tax=Puia sp. P3 TaxID=3423952 RepID=UPI003D671C1E